MGRPKGYERDTVVEKAQALFWAKGWEATSLHDLEAATGLNKFSLYAEFGSKRGLFLACLEAYVIGLLLPVVRAFDPSFPVAFLNVVADQLAAHPRLGCFLLNATQEAAGKDGEFTRWVDLTYGHLRDRMVERWNDPARAEAFVLAVRGLMASGRLGTDPADLRRAIQGIAPLFQDRLPTGSLR